MVYAWAIGQHRDINIGRGRTGRPDPKYWERLAVTLEGDAMIVKVEPINQDKREEQLVPQRPAAKRRSGYSVKGW
ncbi:hypothetical protein COW64_12405 [bacterium (Candidatus Blackallbacteria) CG18_big_fil_WC_8_21_14_2_50_49_26]|nr:MAG: hypothetical protein COW64_12405 [bacterium (Candidatus Blackallbacteria) CG18_big_fil_WC_8_21_14_2_50_49_26]